MRSRKSRFRVVIDLKSRNIGQARVVALLREARSRGIHTVGNGSLAPADIAGVAQLMTSSATAGSVSPRHQPKPSISLTITYAREQAQTQTHTNSNAKTQKHSQAQTHALLHEEDHHMLAEKGHIEEKEQLEEEEEEEEEEYVHEFYHYVGDLQKAALK